MIEVKDILKNECDRSSLIASEVIFLLYAIIVSKLAAQESCHRRLSGPVKYLSVLYPDVCTSIS